MRSSLFAKHLFEKCTTAETTQYNKQHNKACTHTHTDRHTDTLEITTITFRPEGTRFRNRLTIYVFVLLFFVFVYCLRRIDDIHSHSHSRPWSVVRVGECVCACVCVRQNGAIDALCPFPTSERFSISKESQLIYCFFFLFFFCSSPFSLVFLF